MLPNPTAPAALCRERAMPFASAAEAWFWTMAALVARRDGVPLTQLRGQSPAMGAPRPPRPCDPDDVVKHLDRLYRQRRIDLSHARVLRRWGERQEPPDPHRHPGDAQLWGEALSRLLWHLQRDGIVEPGPFRVTTAATDVCG